MPAIRNSGDSEASGAIHWTSRNSSNPSSVPVCTSPSANGWAEARIAAAAYENSRTRVTRRCVRGSEPMSRAGPISSGSSDGTRDTRYM